jgi:carboxylate-amine ligase
VSDHPHHIFEALGIELEYMIVDKKTLETRPISDLVLKDLNDGIETGDVEFGDAAWSNELVKHVIELKANGPSRNLDKLEETFAFEITRMNSALSPYNAMLLPTAMHPLFVPEKDTVIWDREYSEVYQTYNKIFDCRGHGWSNLQSVHINLPFSGDKEFAKLHASIRPVLPILPLLAASSPICESQYGPCLDTRLHYYSQNQRRVPSIIGDIIPERAYSKSSYEQMILEPMYRDVAKLEKDGILQHEWLNSRSAIARFARNAIEIRLIDINEAPSVDFAIIGFTVELIKALASERWQSLEKTQQLDEKNLKKILFSVLQDDVNSIISDKEFLSTFGLSKQISAGDFVAKIFEEISKYNAHLSKHRDTIAKLTQKGNLATRIKRHLGKNPLKEDIVACYAELADCLAKNTIF